MCMPLYFTYIKFVVNSSKRFRNASEILLSKPINMISISLLNLLNQTNKSVVCFFFSNKNSNNCTIKVVKFKLTNLFL